MKNKPTPLKNKIKHKTYNELLKRKSGLFSYEDVKLAVEWLKELIRKEDLSLRVDIFEAIDRAFEDIK